MADPLAFDIQGNPFEVPDQAVGWRLRRMTGRQGPQQVVMDHSTGQPMLVDIQSTAEDLRAVGCRGGKYRLEACDVDGRPLGLVGFTEFSDDEETRPAPPPSAGAGVHPELFALLKDTISVLRSSNERLTETMTKVAEAMAGAFGPVRPVKALPPEPIDVQATEPIEVAPPQTDYMPVILNLAQQFLPVVLQLVAAAKSPPVAANTTLTPTVTP